MVVLGLEVVMLLGMIEVVVTITTVQYVTTVTPPLQLRVVKVTVLAQRARGWRVRVLVAFTILHRHHFVLLVRLGGAHWRVSILILFGFQFLKFDCESRRVILVTR